MTVAWLLRSMFCSLDFLTHTHMHTGTRTSWNRQVQWSARHCAPQTWTARTPSRSSVSRACTPSTPSSADAASSTTAFSTVSPFVLPLLFWSSLFPPSQAPPCCFQHDCPQHCILSCWLFRPQFRVSFQSLPLGNGSVSLLAVSPPLSPCYIFRSLCVFSGFSVLCPTLQIKTSLSLSTQP